MSEQAAEYARQRYEAEENRLERMELKAEWCIALFVGLLGVLMIHSNQQSFWLTVSASVTSLPGLWLCLRCRIPTIRRPFPCGAKLAAEFEEGAESDEKADERFRSAVGSSYAAAEDGLFMVNEWKADCLEAASLWLLITFVLSVAQAVPHFWGE